MRSLPCAMTMLTVALLMTGCQSSKAFHTSIQQATRDISDGRLDAARLEIIQADRLASDISDEQKVEDLTAIVDGAQAMIDGDPNAANAAWSSIHDDELRWQLEQEARSAGLVVNSNHKESIR